MAKKRQKKRSIFFIVLKFIFYTIIYQGVKYVVLGIWTLLKWIFRAGKKAGSAAQKRVLKKEAFHKPTHEELIVKEAVDGDFSSFEKKLATHESLIGIILGARGTGKTAIALRLLENINAKTRRKCFAIGFNEEDMPGWVKVVEQPEDVQNGGFVLVDEGGVLFSSRSSMAEPNKLLSKLMLIARHKDISILFISQNSSNLDVNILRQADYLILKPSSLLQERFERKIIGDIYDDVKGRFKDFKGDKGITYVYSDEFRGFVSNTLPSFWQTKISKSFSKK